MVMASSKRVLSAMVGGNESTKVDRVLRKEKKTSCNMRSGRETFISKEGKYNLKVNFPVLIP